MYKLHIMKQNDNRGTRDFFIVDEFKNTVELGSTHATPHNVRSLYTEPTYTTKKALKDKYAQFVARGYKEI